MTPFPFILFFFGLAVGSFLNVLIDRLSNDESIVYPPSHCDHCKKPLRWYDLIPVISFLVLGGRCRYCKKLIGWQYPFVELLTGFLFIVTFLSMQNSDLISIMYYLSFVSVLVVIFFADLKYGIIPDKIIFPAIIVSVLYLLIIHQSLFINHLFAALGAFLFFLAIFLITRGRGMGFGDVKFAFLLGLFFGSPLIVYTLYLAFLTGGAFSIILLIIQKKKLKEAISFGPFLVLASFLVFFFEKQIAHTIWFLPAVLP